MRLGLFSDLHLDMPFSWAPADVARGRRQALRDTLDAIVDAAIEKQVDALCCGGDLYEHDRVAPDTADVIKQAFARLDPIPVLVAPGNHDWLGPQSVYARTAWSPNVHIFEQEHLEAFELTPGFTIWGGAHRRPAGTDNFLDGFAVDRDRGGVHIALFHGSLRSGLPFEEEGKEAHAPFDEPQIRASGLAHALLGHYHTPKDGDHHTYPGNPDPLTFGETGDRGLVIAQFSDDGTVGRSRINVARSTVSDISLDITGCTNTQEVRGRAEEALSDLTGAARITIHGEAVPDLDVRVSTLDGLGEHLDALVPRIGDINVAYDFDAIAKESTVRGEFVNDVRNAGLDPDQERKVLVTGLRALEGRSDLGVE